MPVTNTENNSDLTLNYPLQENRLQLLTDEEISSSRGMSSIRLNSVAKSINITPAESSSVQGAA